MLRPALVGSGYKNLEAWVGPPRKTKSRPKSVWNPPGSAWQDLGQSGSLEGKTISTRMNRAAHSPGTLGADPRHNLARGIHLSSEAGRVNPEDTLPAEAAGGFGHPNSPIRDQGHRSHNLLFLELRIILL